MNTRKKYEMMGDLVCWFEEALPVFENESITRKLVLTFELEIKFLKEEELEQLHSDHIGGPE